MALPIARIETRLAELRRLIRTAVGLRGASISLVLAAGLAASSFAIDRVFRLSLEARATVLAAMATALAFSLWRYILRPLRVSLSNPVLADLAERRFPGLRDSLRSAVDFRRDARVTREPQDSAVPEDLPVDLVADRHIEIALKRSVIEEASESLLRVDLGDVVDTPRVLSVLSVGLIVLLLAGITCAVAPGTSLTWFRRTVLLSEVEWPYRTTLEVEGFEGSPPTRAIPRGESLAIRARASGEIPSRVRIRLHHSDETRRANLAREGEDLFVFEHPEVTEPFEFTLDGGDFRSAPHRVFVLERPDVKDLRVTLEFPAYTAKERETRSGDLGEIVVPEGTIIHFEGLATKPIRAAWIEAEGRRFDLKSSSDDARHFSGAMIPEKGGLATVHLADAEGVPQDRWVRFLVTPEPDRVPQVLVRTTGVGAMITPQATIGLKVKARDDHGVTALGVDHEATLEGAEPKSGSTALPPIVPARSLEWEGPWDIEPLAFAPGTRLAIKVFALDNDAIHGSKKGFAPSQSFLIVTPERLLEEFLRREEEQRRNLERSIAEERLLRDSVYRLVDTAWKAEGPLGEDTLREMTAFAKAERQLGRQMESISLAMQLILEEMRSNRIAEATETERLAATIIGPLEELSARLLPAAGARIGAIGALGQAADRTREGVALAGDLEAILTLMERVLLNMKRIEGFTEVVNRLRAVLKVHSESANEARTLYEKEVNKIFEDLPPDTPQNPPK